jgi:hypothetical protein
VLIEKTIPETREFTLGEWLDLHMLVMAGGRKCSLDALQLGGRLASVLSEFESEFSAI